MRRDRAVDEARFDALYRAHSTQILAFLLRRTEQPADAADILAEVFTTAWRRIDDVPDGDAGRPWLFGVAHRTLANHARGRRRRNRLADQLTAALVTAKSAPAHASDPRLDEALSALPDEDREIVRLAIWEQLTPGEIAETLGMHPGTVRTRLHRSRARLRATLDAPRTGVPDLSEQNT